MASLCEDRSRTDVSWTEDEQLRPVSISCLCLLLWPSAVHVRGNFSFMPIQNDLRDEQTGFLHLCCGVGRLLSGQGAGRGGGWKQNQGFPCERGSLVLLQEPVCAWKGTCYSWKSWARGGENKPSKGHPRADWAPPGPFHCLGAGWPAQLCPSQLQAVLIVTESGPSPGCGDASWPPKRATSLHCWPASSLSHLCWPTDNQLDLMNVNVNCQSRLFFFSLN